MKNDIYGFKVRAIVSSSAFLLTLVIGYLLSLINGIDFDYFWFTFPVSIVLFTAWLFSFTMVFVSWFWNE